MSNGQLTKYEKLGYYLMCFSTLGFWWYIKVLIKKAMIEAQNDNIQEN